MQPHQVEAKGNAMIYAKLDVCFWRHKKFRRAGVAASGYWAAALAYLREDDSDDDQCK